MTIKVLLVDDEKELAAQIAERLALRGMDVETAWDGETGIKFVEQGHAVDVIAQPGDVAVIVRLQPHDVGTNPGRRQPVDVFLHDQVGGENEETKVRPPMGSLVETYLARCRMHGSSLF